MTFDRGAQISAFLQTAGWASAKRNPLPGDASARRYEKLDLLGEKAVLMDAPAGGTAANPYALTAKLADGSMAAFTAIGGALTERGFAAPKILAADLPAGLLLLEDLGEGLVARILEQSPALEREIYMAAMETLASIYRSSFDKSQRSFGQVWDIRDYDAGALHIETDLMLEWYFPHKAIVLTAAQKSRWTQIWARSFKRLNAHAPGLVLRDFHAENIFWLSEREGTARTGLIDFQDAVMGHPAYDVVSLIEDARRDVDPKLAGPLIAHFCEHSKLKHDDAFAAAYAVMGAQRNAKILGIFVRLAQRDGKPGYLKLLPRVEAHFQNNLAHPAMTELREFLEDLS